MRTLNITTLITRKWLSKDNPSKQSFKFGGVQRRSQAAPWSGGYVFKRLLHGMNPARLISGRSAKTGFLDLLF